jgi:CHAD domain-containing protein
MSSVHAWRVSSRRLLALEQLLCPQATPRRGASLRRALHHAFRASGNLRDRQIAARELQRLTPRFPAAARLARHLRTRLPKHRRRVVRRIRDLKPRTLHGITAGWHGPSTRDSFEAVASARAARRLARARALAASTRRGNDTAASIHGQRIQLKLLRYMTELSGTPAGTSRDASTAKRLASRQGLLGQITDLQVLLKQIDRYGRRHRRWKLQAASLRRHLQDRRRQLLDRHERSTRPG